ncbi:phosphate/phosphite/phosphonate ABC transporter substrate-binding protein [Massilia niastensis]|uniref:phosphate/phosphite/phosphonate ABC transporter substrate-binding protein n=1 Tax=Massilia niastensis TaxID=544911 RepID=UPI0003A5812C|nr:PhnD/SsuA/transferrin family substrate-binding protein [Massilia niastensis]
MHWKVAFPMYGVSARVRAGYEALSGALLAELRADGFAGSVELVRDPPLPDFFTRPDLLFGQTCGYPYLTRLRDHVRLVATPAYDFPGCQGADHASAIVVRADGGITALEQARGRIAAANEIHSNSGMNALRHAVAPLARDGRFFGGVRWSGSHRASLALVRRGRADLAAIDCVTLGYLEREQPGSMEGLTVLQYTAPSPGLPIVAGRAVPEALILRLRAALLKPEAPTARLMALLSISGFQAVDDAGYARILALESQALARGYPQLA